MIFTVNIKNVYMKIEITFSVNYFKHVIYLSYIIDMNI